MSDNTPAWVLRMEKANDATGYHCSGFEANAVAREWRKLHAEIERLRAARDDCAMMIRRLCHNPNSTHVLIPAAIDLLRRLNIGGSPLREKEGDE